MVDDTASDLIAEMQAYYDRRASWYDSSMRYDDADVIRSLAPIFEELRTEMRDRSVLEIACGPGFWTQRVADSARSILATDYNESTLVQARLKGLDPSRVTFTRANAYDLSSTDGEFTGSFAVDWLAHVPTSRLRLFLEELHARLAPQARVAFCDQTPGVSSITGLYDAEGNHLQERTLRDGSRYRVIKQFYSDAEYRARFASYSDDLTVRRFPDQRRVLVCYTLTNW
jgi:ubiquinone/menaquinone biosynthesis C-methylase UbiE